MYSFIKKSELSPYKNNLHTRVQIQTQYDKIKTKNGQTSTQKQNTHSKGGRAAKAAALKNKRKTIVA